jgi:hypothetical protein
VPLRRRANLLERRLLAALVMGRDGKVLASQSGNVGLRETDDGHTLSASILEEQIHRSEPLVSGRHVSRGRQTDA